MVSADIPRVVATELFACDMISLTSTSLDNDFSATEAAKVVKAFKLFVSDVITFLASSPRLT